VWCPEIHTNNYLIKILSQLIITAAFGQVSYHTGKVFVSVFFYLPMGHEGHLKTICNKKLLSQEKSCVGRR